MTAPYILINTLATKPAGNRLFIYMLSLNIDDKKVHKPFFIGSTKNLAKRMARHKESEWHYANFKRPVIVTVLGSVKDEWALRAEVDLKQVLIVGGCDIFTTQLTLKKATDYHNWKKPIFYDLEDWQQRHDIRTQNKTTVENKFLETVQQFTIDDIVYYINSRQDLKTDVLNFALWLASNYNQKEGCIKIIFEDIKNKEDVKKLQDKLNKVRSIWNPQYKLKPYSVNEFRLTKPAIHSISAKKKLPINSLTLQG